MMRTGLAVTIVGLTALLAGCQQPQGELSDMMKPPPRPVELDKLDMFVGRWEGNSEMKVPGSDKAMTGKTLDTLAWDCDKRVLVEHIEATADNGDKYTAMAVWTWDAHTRKYRVWSFDGHGMLGNGKGTYDEASKTWHFVGRDRDPARGQSMYSEGTLTMSAPDTMDWRMTSWDSAWKCRKILEMTGTSRRK